MGSTSVFALCPSEAEPQRPLLSASGSPGGSVSGRDHALRGSVPGVCRQWLSQGPLGTPAASKPPPAGTCVSGEGVALRWPSPSAWGGQVPANGQPQFPSALEPALHHGLWAWGVKAWPTLDPRRGQFPAQPGSCCYPGGGPTSPRVSAPLHSMPRHLLALESPLRLCSQGGVTGTRGLPRCVAASSAPSVLQQQTQTHLNQQRAFQGSVCL